MYKREKKIEERMITKDEKGESRKEQQKKKRVCKKYATVEKVNRLGGRNRQNKTYTLT